MFQAPFLNALSARCELLAWDWIGMGETTWPKNDNFSVYEHIRFALGVLAHPDIGWISTSTYQAFLRCGARALNVLTDPAYSHEEVLRELSPLSQPSTPRKFSMVGYSLGGLLGSLLGNFVYPYLDTAHFVAPAGIASPARGIYVNPVAKGLMKGLIRMFPRSFARSQARGYVFHYGGTTDKAYAEQYAGHIADTAVRFSTRFALTTFDLPWNACRSAFTRLSCGNVRMFAYLGALDKSIFTNETYTFMKHDCSFERVAMYFDCGHELLQSRSADIARAVTDTILP